MSVLAPSRLRPRLAVLAIVAGLLTACGSAGTQAAAPATGSPSSSPADSPTSTDFPRTIKHDKGETTIKAAPKRVVALDNSLVEAIVAVGAPLVGGISTYRDQKGFPAYLGQAVAQTKEVGPLETPNLEAIAALQPDLIVSASVRHEALYDKLSAIAPTVFVKTTGPIWKDNIKVMGQATGREAQATKALTEYETRAQKLGAAINDKAGKPTVSMVRFLDGPTRLYAKSSFSGIVFKDMGLARPPAQDVDKFTVEISEEEIRKADGDVIFVSTFSGGDKAADRFKRNPLWGELNAVKNGKVHDVNDAVWITSVSLQGAHLMMDDMAKIFAVDPMRT